MTKYLRHPLGAAICNDAGMAGVPESGIETKHIAKGRGGEMARPCEVSGR